MSANPVNEFRKRYSMQWSEFLRTEMGQAFQGVIISTIPSATPDDTPHKESGKLGQIFYWQQIYNIIHNILPSPVIDETEVAQDYSGDENPNQSNQPN